MNNIDTPRSSVEAKLKTGSIAGDLLFEDKKGQNNVVKLKIFEVNKFDNPNSFKDHLEESNNSYNYDKLFDLKISSTPLSRLTLLTAPIKEKVWLRSTIIPSKEKKKQIYTLISSDNECFMLKAIRNKNKEFSIYSNSSCTDLIGKITVNFLGNLYKIFKVNEKNSSVLDLETKYVIKIF